MKKYRIEVKAELTVECIFDDIMAGYYVHNYEVSRSGEFVLTVITDLETNNKVFLSTEPESLNLVEVVGKDDLYVDVINTVKKSDDDVRRTLTSHMGE